MKVIEKIETHLTIDNDTICEYFSYLEDEEPTIDGLIDFISMTYISDFEDYDPDISFEGNETELKELYNEYLND